MIALISHLLYIFHIFLDYFWQWLESCSTAIVSLFRVCMVEHRTTHLLCSERMLVRCVGVICADAIEMQHETQRAMSCAMLRLVILLELNERLRASAKHLVQGRLVQF